MKRTPRTDAAAIPPAAAEAALRVGEELRDSRLALGIPIEEMAARLRIRRVHLLALEEGRVRDLPGATYAVGFVRAYAQALGFDPDETVRRFRDAAGGGAAGRRTELVFPEPAPERGVPAGAIVILGGLLAILGYVGWYGWSGSADRMADAVPPLPPRLERVADGAPAASGGAAGGVAAGPSGGGVAPSASPPPPLPPPQPTVAQAAVVPPAAAPGGGGPPGPRPEAGSSPAPEAARVVLRARGGESWVQIRDPRSGQVLLNRVLQAGETVSAPARAGLLLTTGKAENLEVLVDGETVPVLANAVGVRRDIPLEPERLRAAGPVSAASPRPAAQAPPRPGAAAEGGAASPRP